jgi:Flp pilus assembly protein TadD
MTLATSSRMTSHPLLRTVSRWFLGAAGLLWVTIAATLCGCSPLSPVNGWAMNESGKGYYRRGDYAQARREFERALMDNPEKADYAYNVAAAMDQQGDHAPAEKMYRHALTLDPGHQPSYHGLAALMVEEGRQNEANDLLSTWSATQPYSAEAATELGWLKGETGDLDGADRELRRALRQNPRNTRALTQLGKIHGKAGRRQDAAADYARSLFVDPTQTDAQAELAAMDYGPYGSPALQMAGAMQPYPPTSQNFPPFTVPAGQPQMAGAPMMQNQMMAPSSMAQSQGPMSYGQPVQYGQPMMNGPVYSNPSMAAAPMAGNYSPNPDWAQSMGVTPSYSAGGYPDVVSAPMQYNAARPASQSQGQFFQPQQSFGGNSAPQMMTTTPQPMNVSYPQAQMVQPVSGTQTMNTGYSDAPAWNSGSPIPVEQMSNAPVVPAF